MCSSGFRYVDYFSLTNASLNMATIIEPMNSAKRYVGIGHVLTHTIMIKTITLTYNAPKKSQFLFL